ARMRWGDKAEPTSSRRAIPRDVFLRRSSRAHRQWCNARSCAAHFPAAREMTQQDGVVALVHVAAALVDAPQACLPIKRLALAARITRAVCGHNIFRHFAMGADPHIVDEERGFGRTAVIGEFGGIEETRPYEIAGKTL